jgi:hypothetical protein
MHQPTDRSHQFINLLFGVLWSLALALHAVAGVAVEQTQRDPVQRRLSGRDLGEHVDAIAVVLHHARDSVDLPLHASKPSEDLLLGGRVAPALVGSLSSHSRIIPPRGILEV